MNTPFYSPEDNPGTGNDAAGSRVVLKVKGEEKAFDLSDPDQAKKLTDLAQKGLSADQKWAETAEMRRQLESWNNLVESAKTDDAAFQTLRNRIEEYTGRKMSRGETRDILDDVFSDDGDSSSKVISNLKRELEAIKSQQKKIETQRLLDKIESQVDALGKKYSDFDADEVLRAAEEYGITNLEKVYRMVNYDKHLEAARKEGKEAESKLKEKRAAAFTESDSAGVEDPPKPKVGRHKRMQGVGKELLAELKEKGHSLHQQD